MDTPPLTRTDEQIQRDVLDELEWATCVRPNEIGVAVKDGVVTLSGRVDSYTKKWAADEAAHRVRGVTAVANDIDGRPPGFAERSDTDIAAEARHTLEWDASLPIDRIKVSVSRGWVILAGEVTWGVEKYDAECVVRRLAGVKGVNSLIGVSPLVKSSPEEVRREVADALIHTAKAHARRIHVEVLGSTVILRGAVPSWAEKQEAERIAWSVLGVTCVDNCLNIEI